MFSSVVIITLCYAFPFLYVQEGPVIISHAIDADDPVQIGPHPFHHFHIG